MRWDIWSGIILDWETAALSGESTSLNWITRHLTRPCTAGNWFIQPRTWRDTVATSLLDRLRRHLAQAWVSHPKRWRDWTFIPLRIESMRYLCSASAVCQLLLSLEESPHMIRGGGNLMRSYHPFSICAASPFVCASPLCLLVYFPIRLSVFLVLLCPSPLDGRRRI